MRKLLGQNKILVTSKNSCGRKKILHDLNPNNSEITLCQNMYLHFLTDFLINLEFVLNELEDSVKIFTTQYLIKYFLLAHLKPYGLPAQSNCLKNCCVSLTCFNRRSCLPNIIIVLLFWFFNIFSYRLI